QRRRGQPERGPTGGAAGERGEPGGRGAGGALEGPEADLVAPDRGQGQRRSERDGEQRRGARHGTKGRERLPGTRVAKLLPCRGNFLLLQESPLSNCPASRVGRRPLLFWCFLPTNTSGLRIIPLGGLGEIGMNCMALEADGEILVVDCGVTFPRVDLGIDTYRPDLSWLEERADQVKGLVLTHGHEDHIGAVPSFVDRFEVPVWGPEYALELAKLRLDEHGFRPNSYEMRVAKPRGRFRVGRFEVEPVRVTHSIADATALIIRTPAGTVLHTGDFKLDPGPVLSETTDEERLREVGDEGVRLLLSDSTNVDSVGWSGSEENASAVLRNLIETAPARVVVGLFASNVARLQTVGEIAASLG
ncbi:MAG: ribonuclease J, partial [Myxococcales bacterium]